MFSKVELVVIEKKELTSIRQEECTRIFHVLSYMLLVVALQQSSEPKFCKRDHTILCTKKTMQLLFTFLLHLESFKLQTLQPSQCPTSQL